MTIVLHFNAIYDEITGTAHDGHFPNSYQFRLSYQTYYFEIVAFSTHRKELIRELFWDLDYAIAGFGYQMSVLLQLLN